MRFAKKELPLLFWHTPEICETANLHFDGVRHEKGLGQ
jgi:hypothetical protein